MAIIDALQGQCNSESTQPVRKRQRIKPAQETPAPESEVRKRVRREEPLPVTPEKAENKPVKHSRENAKFRHDNLCRMVADLTESQPFQFEGQTWAGEGRTLEAWADAAGIPLRTLKRMIRVPPIVTEATGRPKRTLLRLGKGVALDDAGAPVRKARNVMAAIWGEHLHARARVPDTQQAGVAHRRRRREATSPAEDKSGAILRQTPSPRRMKAAARRRKRPVSGRDFGLICGLAAELPSGWQVKIFEHTLKNWAAFCGVARGQLLYAEGALAQLGEGAATALFKDETGEDHNLDTARKLAVQGKAATSAFFFKDPDLSFMRLLPHVMVDLYSTDAQSAGRDWPGRIAFPE